MNDKNGIALAYGVNMLRLLLSMRLISESEYRSILQLQAGHYEPQKSHVFFFNSRYSRRMYANSCGILRVSAEKAESISHNVAWANDRLRGETAPFREKLRFST